MTPNPFDLPPKSIVQVLTYIGHTQTGRRLLHNFMKELRAGRLVVKADLKAQARKHPELKKAKALFKVSGARSTIHVDLDRPLGVLIPTLVHEMTHSLDREFRKQYSEALHHFSEAREGKMAEYSNLALKVTLLSSEKLAHVRQAKVVKELCASNPVFRQYADFCRKLGMDLDSVPEEAELRRRYKLW